MYITANLPARYGRFNQIREDNYPFCRTFTKYLEEIASLGRRLGMDADSLVGVIEDALLKDMRLPDIPGGEEPVKFRFAIKNETVESYFKDSELANKAIVLLVIRMTLRLSERFGTSLPRLTHLVSGIQAELCEGRSDKRADASKREADDVVRNVDNVVETVDKPVKAAGGLKPKQKTGSETTDGEGVLKSRGSGDVLERLNELVEKGDRLLSEREDGEGVPVVETNPFLKDFF